MLSVFLATIMIMGTGIKPVFAAESEEQSLEEIIRPQIEAFAKSIDQKDADGAAADALAMHGMFKNGKDLRVGEDHALTATLVNSELGIAYFTESVLHFIETEEMCGKNVLYGFGDCRWNIGKSNRFFLYIYDYNAGNYLKNGFLNVFDTKKDTPLPEVLNQYDESLEWMAGETYADIFFSRGEVQKNKIIYDINVVIRDTFDFDTSQNSGFIGLISGIGALLFEEFDWYSTFDFQIEIPNDCEHSFGEWKVATKPNCSENGTEERTCTNCGCAETRATDALGHSFGEWAVETEPSCTESGTERRDCNNCEHYETKEIMPKGHSFGEWYESKAPTYTEEGEERRDCANCEYHETRTLAALDYLLGDLNGDEKINVLDANLVRRYAAEFEELDEKQLVSADVNGDGKVNVLDANLIRRFAAKLITEFSAKN